MKIIAGLVEPERGEVILGHNVDPVYFSQEFDHLVKSRTVLEELLADADLTSREARNLLAQFLFMGDDAFKLVEVLSGGEQCRLALAKILARSPNLLLLDEPFSALDKNTKTVLRQELKKLHQQWQIPFILVTHDEDDASFLGDIIVTIENGHIKEHYLNAISA